MNLVFLGPPGSGKGTQAVRLAESKGLVHLSTGDLLRDAIKEGTELGKEADGYMKGGNLVPDDLIVGLIEDKLASGSLKSGFILDGFPRTIPQAECLKDMLVKNGIALEKAVLIAVDDDEIVRRLSSRWFCPTCQATYNHPVKLPKNGGVCDNDGVELLRRPDDEEGVVRNRLEVYKKQTQPIENFYRKESILAEVSGQRTPDEVFDSILEAVS